MADPDSVGVAIVAIPNQDDYVWKISSEKIPHMTLLFLGNISDASALADISNWVEQVAKTSMSRFGMEVESRGTLGPDEADVLFFGKHNVKKLEVARSYMLTNANVKAAYDAAPQYEGWTPHLTLGYPTTPAKDDTRDYPGFSWVNFDKIAVWIGDYEGPTFNLSDDDSFHDEIQMSDFADRFLSHHGIKGMRWGVRRDERQLSLQDKALNISQRSQVKVASAVSALTAIGISSNAAATAFQLQTRWEHIKMIEAIMQQAQNNPLLSDAGREALKQTRNKVIKGLVASAAMTTAISTTIGVVTHRTAKAYFAPIHKVYGDAKPKIKSEMRQLAKDIKSGKHPSMTTKEYNAKIGEIVARHMTADKKNILQPFHELARSQLGTDYNTKQLKITFEKLPNTDLYSKMTVITPNGLKLVKAIKNIEHADLGDDGVSFKDMDLYFDYGFDQDGFITDFSCPTLEIANDMFEGRLDVDKLEQSFAHSDFVDAFLEHHGVKGMKWGVRKDQFGVGGYDVSTGKGSDVIASRSEGAKKPDTPTRSEKKQLYNALDKVQEVFRSREHAAAFNEQMRNYTESIVKSGRKNVPIQEYREHASGVFSKLIKDHLTKSGLSDVDVKVFPLGPNQFQYVVGDKETVANALNDLGVSKIAHAMNASPIKFVVEFPLDSQGNPNGYRLVEGSFSHSDVMENALAHFGVKGMRWGVRKPVDPDTGLVEGGKAEAKARSVHSPGGMDGDKNTSTDHERAVNAMAKMHERGTAALSNEEIKAIQNRVKAMNELEKLTSNQKSDIQARIDKMKAENELAGLIAARKAANESGGKKLVKAMLGSTLVKSASKEIQKELGAQLAQKVLNTVTESQKSSKKSKKSDSEESQPKEVTSKKTKKSPSEKVKKAFNDVFPDTVPFDKTPPPRPKWDGKVHKITSL